MHVTPQRRYRILGLLKESGVLRVFYNTHRARTCLAGIWRCAALTPSRGSHETVLRLPCRRPTLCNRLRFEDLHSCQRLCLATICCFLSTRTLKTCSYTEVCLVHDMQPQLT